MLRVISLLSLFPQFTERAVAAVNRGSIAREISEKSEERRNGA